MESDRKDVDKSENDRKEEWKKCSDSSDQSTDDEHREEMQRGRRRRLRDAPAQEDDSDAESYASATAANDDDSDAEKSPTPLEHCSEQSAENSVRAAVEEKIIDSPIVASEKNKELSKNEDQTEEGGDEKNDGSKNASSKDQQSTNDGSEVDRDEKTDELFGSPPDSSDVRVEADGTDDAQEQNKKDLPKESQEEQPEQSPGENIQSLGGSENQLETVVTTDSCKSDSAEAVREQPLPRGEDQIKASDEKGKMAEGPKVTEKSAIHLEVEGGQVDREGKSQGVDETEENDGEEKRADEATGNESECETAQVRQESEMKEIDEEDVTENKEDTEEKDEEEENHLNPQYTPRRGQFYEHDDRRSSSSDESSGKEKQPPQQPLKKITKSEKVGKWGHDMFQELDQMPKSSEELVRAYGYDIRQEENAPRARRRRKYGRQPQGSNKKNNYDQQNEVSQQQDLPGRGRGRVHRGSIRGSGRGRGYHSHESSGDHPIRNVAKEMPFKQRRHPEDRAPRQPEHIPRPEHVPHRPEHAPFPSKRNAQDKKYINRESSDQSQTNDRPGQKQNRDGNNRSGTNPPIRQVEPRPFIQQNPTGKFSEHRGTDNKLRQMPVPKDEQNLKDKSKGFRAKEKSVIKPFGNAPSAEAETYKDDFPALKAKNDTMKEASSGSTVGKQQQTQQQSQSKRYSSQRSKNTKPITTASERPTSPFKKGTSNQSGMRSSEYGQHEIPAPPLYGQVPSMPAFSTPDNFSPPLLNGSNNAFMPGATAPSAVHLHVPSFISQTGPPPINAPISYGAPPLPYTPVPMAAPIMEAPSGPYSPSSSLITESQSTGGYAEVRGGVTYFNPSVQPIPGAGVSKRPKAAIPIVDPALASNEVTDWAADAEEEQDN